MIFLQSMHTIRKRICFLFGRARFVFNGREARKIVTVNFIETEEELEKVLKLCYRLLAPQLMATLPGQEITENIEKEITENIYAYNAWKQRIKEYSRLLLYAKKDGEIAAAVLGRPENKESLVCGMAVCDEKFRRQGIAKMLMENFAENARSIGFHYITLGADKNAEIFYEKCGFHKIFEIHGQTIYQKMLI